MRDQHNRNIHYLRLSVTDFCNLRCQYCMPAEGVKALEHGDILSLEAYVLLVKEAVALGIDKVRITGGEPLVRKNILKLIRDLSSLEGIKDLSMTTNGLLLADYAQDLKLAGLNRINISLDTLNPERYCEITRGGDLDKVMAGIEAAKRVGLTPIKLNVVLINGFNTDEISQFIGMADDDLEVRFIELMPIGEAAHWAKEKFIASSELVAKNDLIPALDVQNTGPARYYRKKNSPGLIGFINPLSDHFCGDCNRIRITADGKLKNCLHSAQEHDLRPLLGNSEQLKSALEAWIKGKPLAHRMNEQSFVPITRNMNRIGG